MSLLPKSKTTINKKTQTIIGRISYGGSSWRLLRALLAAIKLAKNSQ